MDQSKKTQIASTVRSLITCAALALTISSASGQELIYREDFETDGEASNPKRYTTTGRDVFEVDRIRSELGIQDQLGPVYWAHNNEVSYTGVPAPTPARRMAMAWELALTESETSPEMLRLFDSAVKWLLDNKANAKIIVSPAAVDLGVLGERLRAAGHTLVDDDTTVTEDQLGTLGDMLVHAPAAGSRGATAKIPVLVIAAADHDDVLTTSIGTATNFEAGQGKVETPSHPAAGGLTGQFTVANRAATWELLGDFLPANPIMLATFERLVPPTVASLDDVDAMIAGTKPSTQATGDLQTLDVNDAIEGNWPGGEALPGGTTGVWGLRATNTITVSEAGTYTLATGAEDGVRVRVDINRNGFDAGDTVINDPGPHANTITYGNVTFPASGTFPIEVTGYNSGAGGNIELSVGLTAGGGQTGLDTNPENWELLGTTGGTSPVKTTGMFKVTGFAPSGPDQAINLPLIMLLNGPNDTPPGSVFGGGPFTGQSGSRFFGGAGMNKASTTGNGLFAIPETGDRTLLIGPIDVRGKENVKLTIAAAGTFLDFERSALTRGSADYLEVAVDTDGTGPNEFERLIFFTPPSSNVKYVDDATTNPSNPTRLGLEFKDVTYDIPEGATDLMIEIRAISTWWNEIFAFDNVRVTAGSAGAEPTVSVAKDGADIVITFQGSGLERTTALGSAWQAVSTTGTTHRIPAAQLGRAEFFRSKR